MAFSASIEMTTLFLSFSLFIWSITLTDLCRVKNPCIPGINQSDHGVWIFKCVAVFCSLTFCWGFLHLCSSVILSSISSISISSVTQLCLTLCNTMDCSMPGFSVHYQLPELTQTHVHWVDDAIQPFHPLLSPSPPAFDLSQHQGVFQWVSSSHQVAKVLAFQIQHQYSKWIFRTDFL